MPRQHGFTLLEVAVVLLILGLLLSAARKGQEMITSAHVRDLISQQDEIRAAYFGFRDRYRALPGDYTQAAGNIPGVAATAACGNGNGDGDGRITTTNNENVLVWEHLSRSGFLKSSYTCAAVESNATTPINAFALRMQLIWDAGYAPLAQPTRHNLKTGGQIPSDILAEVDRKIDDASATSGTFRFSSFDGGSGAPVGSGTCYQPVAPNPWVSDTPAANCGAATLF
jgi:prepilin-type N-terminal cleavage/methylation domain-containing protein